MPISRGGPPAWIAAMLKIRDTLRLRQIVARGVCQLKDSTQVDAGASPLTYFMFLSFAIFMAGFLSFPMQSIYISFFL